MDPMLFRELKMELKSEIPIALPALISFSVMKIAQKLCFSQLPIAKHNRRRGGSGSAERPA